MYLETAAICIERQQLYVFKDSSYMYLKTTAICIQRQQLYVLDWPVKKERRLDFTHVDRNQLDTLYHLKSYTNIVQVFVWLHRHSI